jgi:hypothetical protein
MKTFEEYFCEANKCAPENFSRQIFWRCLHRHALPVAPFILIFRPRYFDADRELIAEIRKAVRMNQVWEEVREYFINPKHVGWFRRKANIRLSARRVIHLAREYLPSSGSPPAPPEQPYRPTSSYSYLEG